MGSDVTERLLLRCEITVQGRTVVSHTAEVSRTQLKLACPVHVEVGAELEVLLSFPKLVEPFRVTCRVTAQHPPDGHGRPPSITCEIVSASAEARDRLKDLAAGSDVAAVKPYRCLVVEDNAFIRDLFAYGVQKYSTTRRRAVSVELAETADAAWQLLEKDNYDMAIIDHYLPSQTGAELIARIRSDPRLRELPVVAISVGGAEVRDITMAAGADLFLDKPIVLRDLFETLDKIAARGAT